jgi:hypothetical protein
MGADSRCIHRRRALGAVPRRGAGAAAGIGGAGRSPRGTDARAAGGGRAGLPSGLSAGSGALDRQSPGGGGGPALLVARRPRSAGPGARRRAEPLCRAAHLRGFDDFDAGDPAGGAPAAHAADQGDRGVSRAADGAAAWQARDPGAVSGPGALWRQHRGHRSRRPPLLRQGAGRIEPGRGVHAGGPAAVAVAPAPRPAPGAGEEAAGLCAGAHGSVRIHHRAGAGGCPGPAAGRAAGPVSVPGSAFLRSGRRARAAVGRRRGPHDAGRRLAAHRGRRAAAAPAGCRRDRRGGRGAGCPDRRGARAGGLARLCQSARRAGQRGDGAARRRLDPQTLCLCAGVRPGPGHARHDAGRRAGALPRFRSAQLLARFPRAGSARASPWCCR